MKISSRSVQLISRIDEVFERDVLDDEAVAELCNILKPGDNGDILDVRVLLHLVESPLVSEALNSDTAPEQLSVAISKAMRVVTPMLGERVGAPFLTQLRWLRRRFEAEKKKFEMVRVRLADDSRVEREAMFAAYLDTSPAPIFAAEMQAQFPELFHGAEELQQSRYQALRADEQLVELLAFAWKPDKDQAQELTIRLEAVVEKLDDVGRVVRTALNDPDPSGHLVAGALAAQQGYSDLASNILSLVVVGSPHAPQLAAFAGHLDPLLSRQGLSKFLVDVLLDQTPEEERLIESELLRRAIVAARTILPKIGSPVEDVREQIDDEAEEIARQVRRTWWFCEEYFS